MKNVKTFPDITLGYLTELSGNNNKKWFEENRDRFTLEFLEPAMQFVIDMGEKLSEINPALQYIPRIDKSIFRLHRDVRFSKNKQPYKTNLGILFWEGSGKKKESSGYYFHLEPDNSFLGTGMYNFTKEQLQKFREIIVNSNASEELNDIMKAILKTKGVKLGGKSFKRVPKGFDPNNKYFEYLLHDGLFFYFDTHNFNGLKKKSLVDYCFDKFEKFSPLHNWLVKNIGGE